MEALAAQEVMEAINNRFVRSVREGTFTVSGGALEADLEPGQWFWIEGSLFNDGLHMHPATDLVDETFHGSVMGLAVPATFQALVEDMTAWTESHPASSSGYTSESFGGYSYSLPTNGSGMAATVYDVFSQRLSRWRRLPCL